MKALHIVAFALTLSLNVSAETTASRTISVDLLRQPLSRHAKQILERAQRAAEAGDHIRAIGFLETALAKYPEAAAWTQSILGVEYLKTRQFANAVTSLEQAVVLLPRDAVDRSNLGFALASIGEYDRAAQELKRALELDGSNLRTRQLLNAVLAANIPQPPPPNLSSAR